MDLETQNESHTPISHPPRATGGEQQPSAVNRENRCDSPPETNKSRRQIQI